MTVSAPTIFTVPTAGDFVTPELKVEEFRPAPDLRERGGELIESCPELAHLARFAIAYFWRKEGGKRRGEALLGNIALTSGPVRYFSEADFFLWLAADHCHDFGLNDQQIEAALYHQLRHAGVKNGRPTIRHHDIEGFGDEIRRYGTWTSELQAAKEVFGQTELPFIVPVPFGSAS